MAPPERTTVGDYGGLCLLIDFSDVPATVGRDEVERFCNGVGYAGFGNNGSVHDYFLEQSIGRCRYTNVVAPYYRAKHPKTYYADPAIPMGQARSLARRSPVPGACASRTTRAPTSASSSAGSRAFRPDPVRRRIDPAPDSEPDGFGLIGRMTR